MDRRSRRTWQRMVWKSHREGWGGGGGGGGGDCNSRYADQGEWKACHVVPERRVQRHFLSQAAPRKASIWLVRAEGGPRLGQVQIVERAWAVVGLCWVLSASDASRR